MKFLTKKIKLSAIFAFCLTLLSTSFVSYAAPPYAITVTEENESANDTTEQSGNEESETSGYYMSEDLPDIVAVNRLLDCEMYGNESYFLSVSDLTEERTYYDHTNKLTYGENVHQNPQFDPNEDLKVHGGQELRVTIFYDDSSRIPIFPCVGSGFFSALKAGETGTIWGQVYLLDSVGFTNSGVGGEDRVYNVIPIVAEEDVCLEYVEGSLVRYRVDEDFRDGTPITDAGLKYFFQDSIEETGLQMVYLHEEWDDPHEHMGYVTYKIRVTKQPNGWDKAEAAAGTAKDKVSELWHSEPAEKAKAAFTDFMSGLGDQASAWLNH